VEGATRATQAAAASVHMSLEWMTQTCEARATVK